MLGCVVLVFSLYCLCVVLQCFPHRVVVVVVVVVVAVVVVARKEGERDGAATKTKTPQHNVGKKHSPIARFVIEKKLFH